MSDVELHEQRAERGRKILAEIRQQDAEDKARFEAFAATVQSPKKKYVHRREPAAAMVAAAIGTPYSGELLRRSDCRYAVIGRTAYYAEDDLRELAEFILDSASERRGTPDRRRRKQDNAGAEAA
jgi:hypothetical protein